jgi:hypothetical protein
MARTRALTLAGSTGSGCRLDDEAEDDEADDEADRRLPAARGPVLHDLAERAGQLGGQAGQRRGERGEMLAHRVQVAGEISGRVVVVHAASALRPV